MSAEAGTWGDRGSAASSHPCLALCSCGSWPCLMLLGHSWGPTREEWPLCSQNKAELLSLCPAGLSGTAHPREFSKGCAKEGCLESCLVPVVARGGRCPQGEGEAQSPSQTGKKRQNWGREAALPHLLMLVFTQPLSSRGVEELPSNCQLSCCWER